MKQPTPELARPTVRYVAGATLAHIMAVAEVTVVVTALGREATTPAHHMFEGPSPGIVATVVITGIVAVMVGSALNYLPSLRWYAAGQEPTPQQREAAMQIPRRQTLVLAAVWGVSAAAVLVANHTAAVGVALLIVPAAFFGATAAILTSLLLTVRTLRPITAAAVPKEASRDTAPGVMARLLSVWVLINGLPSLGIALLILARSHGWMIDRSASVEIPVLVLLAVAVVWGLRTMILVSQSISDPVRDVVDAMADVERGNLGHTVAVYERSEIGRLQSGFNRMMSGLQERDRLRDLFGRHVGDDVVRLLVERDESLYRDVRDVAVLFVDLTGSTRLAANRPPEEVADILNTFFQTVVAAVDKRNGFINKFQGDAALAIFGAPVPSDTAASDALATARDLGAAIHLHPELDYGVGVSAGPVFAGFVGAAKRFEYTVIGDAVNEAARLADRAKETPGRALCSAAAFGSASGVEQSHWDTSGSEVLRGRNLPTDMFMPADAAMR
ncbi:MAG TPA: adenylate/guanylate cyclase domain-containing protein [Mycobacterium sp.]